MGTAVRERMSERTTIEPGLEERPQIAGAKRFFRREPARAKATLTGPDGAQLELSASLYEALRQAARARPQRCDRDRARPASIVKQAGLKL